MSLSSTGLARSLLASFSVATSSTMPAAEGGTDDALRQTAMTAGVERSWAEQCSNRADAASRAPSSRRIAQDYDEKQGPYPLARVPRPTPAPLRYTATSRTRIPSEAVHTAPVQRSRSLSPKLTVSCCKLEWPMPTVQSEKARVGDHGPLPHHTAPPPWPSTPSQPIRTSERSATSTGRSQPQAQASPSADSHWQTERSHMSGEHRRQLPQGGFTPRIRYGRSASTSPERGGASALSRSSPSLEHPHRDESRSTSRGPSARADFPRWAFPTPPPWPSHNMADTKAPAATQPSTHFSTWQPASVSPLANVREVSCTVIPQGRREASGEPLSASVAPRDALPSAWSSAARGHGTFVEDAVQGVRCGSLLTHSGASLPVAVTTAPLGDTWLRQASQAAGPSNVLARTGGASETDARSSDRHRRGSPCGREDAEVDGETEPHSLTIEHSTLRSISEEYHRASVEGTVDFSGLQIHLRGHTHSCHVTTLDLTRYPMRRGQWSWFTQAILPQLHALEKLLLVQMCLGDEEVTELVRGSCGSSTPADRQRSAVHTSSPKLFTSISPCNGREDDGGDDDGAVTPAASSFSLRCLDLSGNAITQRSCTHLGRLLLWMASTLEEVRLLGNPLKDYGFHTLSVYIAKMNTEAVEQDPTLFSPALRHLFRQQGREKHLRGGPLEGSASSRRICGSTRRTGSVPQREATVWDTNHGRVGGSLNDGESSDVAVTSPIGLVLLDLRDCRASVRGLSDILAAASRAQRLHTLILSHNVTGVTSLLPQPMTTSPAAAEVVREEEASEERDRYPGGGRYRNGGGKGRDEQAGDSLPRSYQREPFRLRLVKTPLISSGALLRHQLTIFRDVVAFASSCSLSILALHGVPLSQTCSPVGCRELLLNIFFSCSALALLDLSDTFEKSLVPSTAMQSLIMESTASHTVAQELSGPAFRRSLQAYREDEGEAGFLLNSTTLGEQTRIGDIVAELMAHAAFNAVVRHRLAPTAFQHIRELHLSNSGVTDAGARGLCVCLRQGRARTGMLASLTALNLSDNLMTGRGCAQVISAFLLEDNAEKGEEERFGSRDRAGDTFSKTMSPPDERVHVSLMTALSLQRNAGVSSSMGGDSNDGAGATLPADEAFLREVCAAAEAAVTRRATLLAAAGSDFVDGSSALLTEGNRKILPLTVCFSAPPREIFGNVGVNGERRRRTSSLPDHAAAMRRVFYAGCDERGTAFCTCPSGRLYMPDGVSAATLDPGGHVRHDRTSLSQQSPAHSMDVAVRGRGAPHASPRTESSHSSSCPAAEGAWVGTKKSEKPPRSPVVAANTAVLGMNRQSLNDLWRPSGQPLHDPNDAHLTESGGPVPAAAVTADSLSSSSFFSFPQPPSIPGSFAASRREGSSNAAVAATCAGAVGPAGPPPPPRPPLLLSRRESDLSVFGASGGTDFLMGDLTAVAVAEEETGAGQQSAPLVSTAKRIGGRRAQLRRMRTFILSYDHPVGHILCRALHVLQLPPPDLLGEGARAALDADLLTALRSVCTAAGPGTGAASVSEEEGEAGVGDADGMAGGIVVDQVHYVPPTLPVSGSPDDAVKTRWMRFEIVTNLRKRNMARCLQEVLNVPWASQQTSFGQLLQFLAAHARCSVAPEGARKWRDSLDDGPFAPLLYTEDLWDPVEVVERAAAASAAVRTRLQEKYYGAAAAAVHAHHADGYPLSPSLVSAKDVQNGNTGTAVRSLDQFYAHLWQELGLSLDCRAMTEQCDVPRELEMASVGGERSEDGGWKESGCGASPRDPEGRCNPRTRAFPGLDDSRWSADSGKTLQLSTPNPSSAVAVPGRPLPMAQVIDLYDDRADIGSDEVCPARSSNEQPAQATASSESTTCAHDEQASKRQVHQCAIEGNRHGTSTAVVQGVESLAKREGKLRLSSPEDAARDDAALLLGTAHDRLLVNTNASTTEEGMLLADQLECGPSPLELKAANTAAAPSPQPHFNSHDPRDTPSRRELSTSSATEKNREATTSDQHIDFEEAAGMTGADSGRGRHRKKDEYPAPSLTSRKALEGRAPMMPRNLATEELKEGEKREEETEGELSAILPPIRVQRRASELVGRMKMFTLTYIHQEGTAVCRAWRLLHTTAHGSLGSGGDSGESLADAVTPVSPHEESALAALARKARTCLCEDFLALLQPPDNDLEHAVHTVSLSGDSGVATPMLQLQVHTNERRATLADRLQHSNHGLRREAGRGSRGGLVPLSVLEVDRFYFPRLTRLLRQNPAAVDTVAQVQAYLQSHTIVQARLLKNFCSVAALVHYFHCSPAALDHELGSTSWQTLADSALRDTPDASPFDEGARSPNMAEDRVRRHRDGQAAGRRDKDGSASPRSGSGGGAPQQVDSPLTPPQAVTARSALSMIAGEGVAAAIGGAVPSDRDNESGSYGKPQGLPPPRPRRPPTPPHALTHTNSISLEEVTEDPTSEGGPIVVLRGSTPAPLPSSLKSPTSPDPRYFPLSYRLSVSPMVPPSHSASDAAPGEVAHREVQDSEANRSAADSALVSSLTAASSPAGSTFHHPSLSAEAGLPADVKPSSAVAALAAASGCTPVALDASPLVPSPPSASSEHSVVHGTLEAATELHHEAPEVRGADGARSYHHDDRENSTLTNGSVLAPSLTAPGASPKNPKTTERATSADSSLLSPSQSAPAAPRRSENAPAPPQGAYQRETSAAAAAAVTPTAVDRARAEFERLRESKYKRLMRVAYEGVTRGSVPLEPQHQQKTVIGRGKWGTQKVELSLEWEILFVLTFERSCTIGRSSRRAQMLLHPVGCGFECMAGDEVRHTTAGAGPDGDASSLNSSIVNSMTGGDGGQLQPSALSLKPLRRTTSRKAASHLIILVRRPFMPDEVGSSAEEMEKTLMAGAQLTVPSTRSVLKAGRLFGGGGSEDLSNASVTSNGLSSVAQDFVYRLSQPSVTLDIEMKNPKRVQEALRLLGHSIRRATQAMNKSVMNAQRPSAPSSAAVAAQPP